MFYNNTNHSAYRVATTFSRLAERLAISPKRVFWVFVGDKICCLAGVGFPRLHILRFFQWSFARLGFRLFWGKQPPDRQDFQPIRVVHCILATLIQRYFVLVTYLPQSSPNSYFGHCVVPTSDTIVRCRERPSVGFSLAMLVPAPQERTETTSKRGLMNSFTGWVTGT